MSNYTSSIVNKYGDTENVKRDTKTLFEIMDRQGTTLLIDAVAEYSARSMQKFNLPYIEKSALRVSLVDELNDAINERI